MLDFLISTKRENLIDMENAPIGNSPLHLLVRNFPQEGQEKIFINTFDDLIHYMKSHKISGTLAIKIFTYQYLDNPIDMQNKDGETPLHAACLKANEFCI